MEKTKTYIGKLLLLVSVILCIYMIFSNLTNVIFEIDEYFTFALVKFPLTNIITITSNDVHPPLYYLILKLVIKTLNTLNINYNLLYVLKLVSIIPYVFILIVSATKIKNEYNWLTAGLLAFTLITLSEFYINYLSIRMYSWAILFLLFSFIYLKGIFENSDRKSWILFTIFTILGAYTHYFVALSSILIYLSLLIYFIYNKDKSNFKKWILSVIVAVISYLPWVPHVIMQMNYVHQNFWVPQINFDYLINCISSIALNNSDFIINSGINLPLLIITLVTLIVLMTLTINEYKNNKNSENYYILIGIFLFLLTIIIGILFSITFKPIIRVRYIVPSIAVFWFAVSIIVGKLDNKKLLTLTLSLIIILSVFCFAETINSSNELAENGIYEQNLLNDIKHDNNNIVITTGSGFFQFGTYINESKLFTNVDGFYGINDNQINKLFEYKLVSGDKFKNIVKKYNNKTIYLIEPNWDKIDVGSDVVTNEIHHIPNSGFTIYSIEPT